MQRVERLRYSASFPNQRRQLRRSGELVHKKQNASHRVITLSALLAIVTATAALPQAIPFAGQMKTNDGPTITFTDTTVSCNGLSPGDSIALVGFVIDRQANSQTITIPTISQHADADGAFTATIEGGVKARSIWLLIDETTFSYTIAAPAGSVLRQLPEGAISLGADLTSQAENVTILRAHTHVIAISDRDYPTVDSRTGRIKAADARPSGITVFDAKDGTSVDTDGSIDGTVHLLMPSFLDPSQRAAYLFIVDDRTLEFRALALTFNSNGGRCRPGEC